MKLASPLALLGLLLLLPGAARADDKMACLDAASKAQTLRAGHQLVAARDQLRVCAAATCPAVVQTDCVTWLAEVEKSIPGVVVSAKSAAGADLIDVKVTVDGQPFMAKLTGQATAMDAGPHAFHFEAADGSALDQQVLVREGVKDQAIAVVLAAPGSAPAVVVAPGASAPPSAAPAEPPPASSGSPLRTVGWVMGGVGAAGVVVGVVSGIIAVSDKSGANCTGTVCQGSVSGVKSAALASTVGFVAGGVLLAGGVGLILFAPKGGSSGTGVRVLPMFTADGGQLVAGGSF